jgi:hypothetical protein
MEIPKLHTSDLLNTEKHSFSPVFRIRVRRIRKFFGLPDPDPLVRGTDPDPGPSIIKQKE